MNQIKVFQTKDGTLFHDRGKAESHELMLSLRGLIQTQDRSSTFTPTQMASFITDNQDKIFDNIRKYRNTMNSLKGAETKKSKIG